MICVRSLADIQLYAINHNYKQNLVQIKRLHVRECKVLQLCWKLYSSWQYQGEGFKKEKTQIQVWYNNFFLSTCRIYNKFIISIMSQNAVQQARKNVLQIMHQYEYLMSFYVAIPFYDFFSGRAFYMWVLIHGASPCLFLFSYRLITLCIQCYGRFVEALMSWGRIMSFFLLKCY